MKTLQIVVSAVTLVASVTLSAPADELVYRVGGTRGLAPSHDILVFTDKIEVMAYGAEGKFPIYEIGRLWPVSKSKHHVVLAGIYGSRREKVDQWHVEPFMLAKAWRGKTTGTAKLFSYLPLNGGPTLVGADELSVVHSVTPTVGIGVEGTFFKANPSPLEVQWGPTIRLKRGDTSVSARYLSFGRGAESFRLTVSRSLP